MCLLSKLRNKGIIQQHLKSSWDLPTGRRKREEELRLFTLPFVSEALESVLEDTLLLAILSKDERMVKIPKFLKKKNPTHSPHGISEKPSATSLDYLTAFFRAVIHYA